MDVKILLIALLFVAILVTATLILTGYFKKCMHGNEKQGGLSEKEKDKTKEHTTNQQKNETKTFQEILPTGVVSIKSNKIEFKAYIDVPENWNKKCVILVHGLGRSHEVWIKDGTVKDLKKNGYCVLLFDLPLHGERGKMKTLGQLAYIILQGSKDIVNAANYLKEHGAKEVYIISRSLGSIVTSVALGNGATIDKAELLLAGANLTYLYEHGAITSNPKAKSEMGKWINTPLVKEIDPLYKLPKYTGQVHFHCGKKDNVIPPKACQYAFDVATSASERKLFWHDRGHSMPKDEYIDEALDFFGAPLPSVSENMTVKNPVHPTPSSPEPGEPPIFILFVLHIEPKLVHGEMDMSSPQTLTEYNNVKNELLWLMNFADKENVKMTGLFNGWYMQLALRQNDLSHLSTFLSKGHEIGTHAHNICYNSTSDKWYVCPSNPDQWFRDAKIAVDKVLSAVGKGSNRAMCAMFPRGQYQNECSLMSKYGYDIGVGNRPEIAINFFDHIVWNPWRPKCINDYDHSLEEDFNTPFVSIDHRAQIGSSMSHGVDSTVKTLKRQFLMVFLEWKVREVYDFEDKTWTWGVVHHPNYGSRYNNDIEQFFKWLNRYFINVKTPKGNIIAVHSTASQVADVYYKWERKHPGRSSFSYVNGDLYPYLTEFAKNKLSNSIYQTEVQYSPNIVLFILTENSGKKLIVVWNKNGTSTKIDLSSYFMGVTKVNVCRPWGACYTRPVDKIYVGDLPLLVEEP